MKNLQRKKKKKLKVLKVNLIQKNSISVLINYGDEKIWTGSETPKSTTMWVEVPFSEFYSGNSRATGSLGADILYTIDAELNGM